MNQQMVPFINSSVMLNLCATVVATTTTTTSLMPGQPNLMPGQPNPLQVYVPTFAMTTVAAASLMPGHAVHLHVGLRRLADIRLDGCNNNQFDAWPAESSPGVRADIRRDNSSSSQFDARSRSSSPRRRADIRPDGCNNNNQFDARPCGYSPMMRTDVLRDCTNDNQFLGWSARSSNVRSDFRHDDASKNPSVARSSISSPGIRTDIRDCANLETRSIVSSPGMRLENSFRVPQEKHINHNKSGCQSTSTSVGMYIKL